MKTFKLGSRERRLTEIKMDREKQGAVEENQMNVDKAMEDIKDGTDRRRLQWQKMKRKM